MEKLRASHETKILSKQDREQEEPLDKSATTSISNHTKVLPYPEEPQAFRALSPLESDGANEGEHAEEEAKSENQSVDTIPLEQNTSMETVPLKPEGNIVSPSQAPHT